LKDFINLQSLTLTLPESATEYSAESLKTHLFYSNFLPGKGTKMLDQDLRGRSPTFQPQGIKLKRQLTGNKLFEIIHEKPC